MTLLYTITFLVGLVGNSLGMYVVCQKCGIKGATHLLIANLACSNLLITFIVMPMSVLYLYNEHRWHAGLAGSITCKLSQFLFMFPIAASILTILVVSIDRFYAVFYPLNGQVFRRPKTMTATIWISSAILVSPSFVIFQAVLSSDGEWRCVTYFGQDRRLASVLTKVYFSVLFVLLYLLPLLIITLLYTLISCKLHRRKVPGQARSKTTRTTADKSKRKIVKVLVMIVLAFALCWFPAHVIHYYAIFQSDDYQNLPPYLHPLLLWVSHTNSAIDPCLYILLSQNFRREFRQVLTHCGYFQKRKRIEKRMSRMTSNFPSETGDRVAIPGSGHFARPTPARRVQAAKNKPRTSWEFLPGLRLEIGIPRGNYMILPFKERGHIESYVWCVL